MAEDIDAREPATVGSAVVVIKAAATVLANLTLGWLTWLPATFVVAGVVEALHGEGSAGYTSDPGIVQPIAAGSAVLIILLFVTVNLLIHLVLPGRHRWIWLAALVTYPIPWLIMQASR